MKRKHKNPASELSPEEFQSLSLQRFEPLLTVDEYNLLQVEVKRPLLPAIRINPLKSTTTAILDWQARYGWKVSTIPFCGEGYWVDDKTGIPVSQTVEHRLGLYYIQEAASMLPVGLFDIDTAEPGLTLDLAASPGGKTTHLVSRTLDHGLVLANDSSQGRIPALRIVLQNWGAVNTAISQFPGEKLGAWFPETFDRALIDAPCSMQGLRTAESHTSRPVTEKESSNLSKRQAALLSSALQAVKVGGQVVYSTCTLLPEEDEGVVDHVLRRFGSVVRLVDVQSKLPSPAPGLTKNGIQQYDPKVSKTLRLWPHRLGTAGFFACLFEKTAPLDLPTQTAPARPLSRARFLPVSMSDEQKIIHQLQTEYGFDLCTVLAEYSLTLMQRLEKVIAFPTRILDNFSELPLEFAGILLGELNPEGLTISHEWATRFGSRFSDGQITLTEEQTSLWLRGEDCFDLTTIHGEKGQVLIVRNPQGLVIGRGKVLKDRLKNLLLRRLI